MRIRLSKTKSYSASSFVIQSFAELALLIFLSLKCGYKKWLAESESSVQDGDIGRYTLPSHTTKRKKQPIKNKKQPEPPENQTV